MNKPILQQSNLFSKIFGLLKSPGDSITAKITPSNRQVIRVHTKESKISLTRYPSTNTIVKTEVFKEI